MTDIDCNYFCKFRSMDSEDFLKLLPSMDIYIPTVAQLNDPLEGALTAGYMFADELLPTKTEIDSYIKKVGVYSVSIHKQIWHASNFLPMWASYGNGHKGVCMVFKRKPLDDDRYKWVEMHYQTHPHNHEGANPQSIKPPQFTRDMFLNAQVELSRKYDYWKHEREWRLITKPGSAGIQPMSLFFELHALVFGYMSEDTDILKLLNKLPSEVQQRLMTDNDVGIFKVEKPSSQFPLKPLSNLRHRLESR